VADSPPPVLPLLHALDFAARKHRDQRRKGAEATPYINHPIEVAYLLAASGVTDLVTLQAAVLHDTLEDTETTRAELEEAFGSEVLGVVREVTDDRRLPKEERKRLQTEHAPGLSDRAKRVKVADKISNVRAIAATPPAGWSEERRREYLDWTERVVAGCRGCSPALEAVYDRALAESRRLLGAQA
jgi:(p)ppGpp synthase/HD superfamily hydrolase